MRALSLAMLPQYSTVGPFKWAIGHFAIYFIFSLLMNRFWQMKAQNDREIIQMNNIDQELVLITN